MQLVSWGSVYSPGLQRSGDMWQMRSQAFGLAVVSDLENSVFGLPMSRESGAVEMTSSTLHLEPGLPLLGGCPLQSPELVFQWLQGAEDSGTGRLPKTRSFYF